MAMRLPGDVRTSKDFWDFLINKKDGHGRVPSNRYEVDSFYHPFSQGCIKTKHGYFLREDPAYFDAGFFDMTAYEASHMDPQQRLLLEVVWECLENAGEVNWEGKDIGCYVGVFGEDWLSLSLRDPLHTDRSHALSTGGFALANMISYKYDFQGPSMTIQTGCSSSLVGLHEACQSLIAGDCSSAIVGGSNLILSPTMTASLCSSLVLSPSGLCRTFDAQADGYGRGEAINVLYLKRLDDALRSNDPIRAVISSTAIGSDGKTASISTPSIQAQESLIKAAYRQAGIQALSETAFVECHGTGTVAGDTTECSAIGKVFAGQEMFIGAVKPNFGHSEGASGITSVIKAVLSLEHAMIPPNTHLHTPNSTLLESELKVPCVPLDWPADRRKRVSVNGFGIGGTNAHVVVDAASDFRAGGQAQESLPPKGPVLLVVSAQDPTSLQSRVKQVTDYANANPNELGDLAFTLAVRRRHLTHRAFVICNQGALINSSDFYKTRSTGSPRVTFAFTGQGAQWAGMGKALMETYESFQTDMAALSQILSSTEFSPSWSLGEELSRVEGSRVNEAELAQPLTTAVQIGLVNLLAKFGVRPSQVVGHSSGEIAAAYAAGAISAKSAITIAYHRGRLAKSKMGRGEMASIGLSRDDIEPYIVDGVVIACQNGPRSVTISGDKEKINHVVEEIKRCLPDVFCRRLRLNIAYHSHHMKSLGPSYEAAISTSAESNDSMLPMFSSVTTKKVTDSSQLTSAYWRQNLESPVRFDDAVNTLLDNGDADMSHVILEVGPHSALSSAIKQIFQARKLMRSLVYVPTLVRHDPDCQRQLMSIIGHVHINGVDADLLRFSSPGRVLTTLSPYPWNHATKYWSESRVAREWRLTQHPHHELLGLRCTESTDFEPSWRVLLGLDNAPWLSAHVLQGQVVFPGAGYISMVGEAVQQLSPETSGYSVKNVMFRSPLTLDGYETVEIVTTLSPRKVNDLTDSEWFLFTIASHDGNKWIKNCTGQVRAGSEQSIATMDMNQYARPVSSKSWYNTLSGLGLSYGEHFRGLQDITADPCGNRAAAQVTKSLETPTSRYAIHPTMIDQCIQLMSVAGARGLSRHIATGAIPASIERLYVGAGGNQMHVNVDVTQESSGSLAGNATAVIDGKVVLSICRGLCFSLGKEDGTVGQRIPLTARIQWMPDFDLTDRQALFPPVAISDEMKRTFNLMNELSVLLILDTANLIKDAQPKSANMAKWKGWIIAQAMELCKDHQEASSKISHYSNLDARILAVLTAIKSEQPNQGPEVTIATEYMEKIHDHCLDLVAGSVSALDLLMDEDNLAWYYSLAQKHTDWSQFLRVISHANPRIRILEIGAGTGSATAAALESLCVSGIPTYSEYIFTDILPESMETARVKFKNHRYPIEQGYLPHTFDLVIASNVIHATPVLKQTLENVRKLLTPQGHLLLHELNPETHFTDYIMGTLPGWWIGQDDRRIDKPYISPERWNMELQAAGFTGVDTMRYDLEPPIQMCATITAQVATNLPKRISNQCVTLVTVECVDNCNYWHQLFATELMTIGYALKWGTLDDLPKPGSCVILLLDVPGPFLYDISQREFELLQRYLGGSEKCTFIWVTRAIQLSCLDPRYSLVPGFVRSLRDEMNLDLRTVEVDTFNTQSAKGIGAILGKVLRSKGEECDDLEFEFTVRNGTIHTSRCHWGHQGEDILLPPPSSSKKLDIGTNGLINTLQWVGMEYSLLRPEEVEVKLCYIGLNFRDIMVAMGFVGQKSDMGVEGTGIVQRVGDNVRDIAPGDRVLLLTSGIMRTHAVVDQTRLIRLPESLSMEDAATMGSVFATAIYSLIHLAQLRKDQSILIHSACGGVGLAAIQICQLLGVDKIFATVGNQSKREHLVDNVGLHERNIFNSRDRSFLPSLMERTGRRGADVVLNSLSGQLLHTSWECVAPLGKMIELGKRDFLTNGNLSMAPFLNNRSFFGVDLLELAAVDPGILKKIMGDTIALYSQGKIQPIHPITTFEAIRIVEAFRYMQSGAHIGKVLIKMPDDSSQLPSKHVEESIRFSPDASYLLVGGLGGLGRTVSTWMVENGARYLVLLSRSAGSAQGDQEIINELELMGCSVQCVRGDVADIHNVQHAVSTCQKPLKGVLHMALSLNDCPYLDMTFEQWQKALAPKVTGAWNLHHSVPNERLDFFVVFSSTSGICGNSSQANYAAANTFLDGFTQNRRHHGYPSSVLALGAVDEVGLVSRDPKLRRYMASRGIKLLSPAEVLEGLRLCIHQSSVPSAIDSMGPWSAPLIAGLSHTRPISDPTVRPIWHRDARFRSYTNLEFLSTREVDTAIDNRLRELLDKAERDPSIVLLPETETTITKEFIAVITQHMPESQTSDDEAALKMVIDSLMAVEVKSWIRRNLGLEVSLADISKAHTVGGLAALAVARLRLKFNVGGEGGDQAATEAAT
ncbi:putative polyketide synthase [Aspergillus taichungensis]|uniref:Putative polyketide synthase n=1 Tax=Aspergillus taichungensis TaxID=482145 RepID=A0A2J5I7P0_9EURO|nr:putative polyketide synthase [Aspergillus taichungensis]